ncbi:cytochrome-c peroxidase [Undibacterium sp.]|jgi:cytochrome c peroxidase|uniref:cytochrome-c peroxidase n=1 Tax=Undibacterium sp. TaxID=1914977 RepID=UPI002BC43534|nr:cytochrome c peroxidase [Undibacterium sp.]HTD07081.1 cytochrome c peroxidase [Undibacterium sp.]
MRVNPWYFSCPLLLILAACGGAHDAGLAPASNTSQAPSPVIVAPVKLSLAAQVGQKMFFDQSLSGSGKMSCATCHDPAFAYAPPNKLAVQLGGPRLDQPGNRAAPSLRYKDITPAYADLLDNPDGVSAPGPGGGFTADGRVNTLAEQAKIPLLDPVEMANADGAEVVGKIQASGYADLFRQAFGQDAFADSSAAFNNAARALQAFQMEDVSFHPYSSKFDLYAANKIGGTLTAAEMRGLQIFSDPKTGNCSSCHYQGAGLNGSSALFTDFSYEAIGVPRNAGLPLNQDPAYFDLGVCGPLRNDHKPKSPTAANSFCGMFKTPTLRNVATRSAFFHNGVITSLEQAIQFYNTRDTMPELWYPTVGGTALKINDAGFPAYGLIKVQYKGGTVQKYNDLAALYQGNIDPQLPLDGRKAGAKPPMTDKNIADLICFLGTLTDGYQPGQTVASGKCAD